MPGRITPAPSAPCNRSWDQYPLEKQKLTRDWLAFSTERERPQETIAVIQRGLATDPEYGDFYNVLGVCFLGLGRYDEAIAAHQRYVQLAPNEPNAHDSLGMSFQQSGKYERAVSEYNAALSLDLNLSRPLSISGTSISSRAATARRSGSTSATFK